MLEILSDLNRSNRMVKVATDGVIASGVNGTWVTLNASDEAAFPTGATRLAFPIWTESRRDGTVGWTPDVAASGNKVTIMDSYLRALTDQVTSYATLALGDMLTVGTDGKLVVTTDAAEKVAIVMKKHDSFVGVSTTFTNCIEFTTGR